jgi:hypothetical protein
MRDDVLKSQISDFRFQIPDFRFQISDPKIPDSDLKFGIWNLEFSSISAFPSFRTATAGSAHSLRADHPVLAGRVSARFFAADRAGVPACRSSALRDAEAAHSAALLSSVRSALSEARSAAAAVPPVRPLAVAWARAASTGFQAAAGQLSAAFAVAPARLDVLVGVPEAHPVVPARIRQGRQFLA